MKIKNIHIFGGGTVEHITNHFSVCASAYGNTARNINKILSEDPRFDNFNIELELTKMAGGTSLETNNDISERIDVLRKNLNTKIIFFNCALVDFKPAYLHSYKETRSTMGSGGESLLDTEPNLILERFGKYESRLETNKIDMLELGLIPTSKIINSIRNGRKDIYLVGFKTTCGATRDEMYRKGLALCKSGGVNLVLVNDTKTRLNFIVVPEEATYCETTDRDVVLRELCDIVWHRSHLTFTQSNVIAGKPVSWQDERIPDSLRQVVNHVIKNNGYKPFGPNKITSGHFAIRLSDTEFLTSIRKTNLNDLEKTGMVYVKTDGPDTVLAYGAKPSVGGQSQRIVFKDHVGYDCIVHFHSELKNNHKDEIPIISQRENECGSIQCGIACSNGLKPFGNLKAVMLNNHGPNIIFNKNINPLEVIQFIDSNWDINKKTGGYQL